MGVPLNICDQSREQLRVDARLICNEAGCHVIELKKGTPDANREYISMNILNDGCKRYMFDTNSPMVFWCYFSERRVSVINATIRVNHLLEGQPPHSRLKGQLTGISSICKFGWNNWVCYRVEGHKPPFNTNDLERHLGHQRIPYQQFHNG